MVNKLEEKPSGIYDEDDNSWQQPSRYSDDETNLADLEDDFASAPTADKSRPDSQPSDSDPKQDLAERENGENAPTTSESEDNDDDFGFTEEEEPTGRLGRLRDRAGRGSRNYKRFLDRVDRESLIMRLMSNKIFAGIGIGSGAIAIVLIIVFMLFFGNMKILHLAENITTWNMARAARSYRISLSQTTAESIEADAAAESRLGALRSRFQDSKIFAAYEKYNTYRPEKMLAKFETKLTPKFVEGPPSKILKRPTKQFLGWEYEGVLIEKTDSKFFTPIQNYKDKLRFAAEFDALLERESIGANSYVRSQVLKKALRARGIKLRVWDKAFLKKITPEAAESMTQALSYERSKTPRASGCISSEVCAARDKADDAVEEVVKNAKNETADEVGEKADDAAAKVLQDTIGTKVNSVLQTTSAVYAVAVPLCLVFDGSIENSKDATDNKESALQNQYFLVRTAADQIKAGDTNSTAISGLSKKLGEINDSVPVRRANGENINTVQEINPSGQPQASATGTYSLLNVLLDRFGIPQAVLDTANSGAQKTCRVLTDIKTGIALTAVELGLAVFSLGSSEGALKTASTGFGTLIKTSFSKFLTRAGLETGIKEAGTLTASRLIARETMRSGSRLALKIGLQVGATIGATELAKMIVLHHMNGGVNGLATNANAATQADMGGNLKAQEDGQKVLYGRPMLKNEVAASVVADNAYIKSNVARLPFKERYFAITNPFSFVSKMGFAFSSFTQKFTNTNSFVPTILGSVKQSTLRVASTLTSSQKARAEETIEGAGPYNIVQWGWSEEENNIVQNNPDYAPIDNEIAVTSSGKEEEIQKEYGDCFTKTMGELLANKDIQRTAEGEVIKDAGKCSPDNLGINNKKYGDLVFRWRLKMRNDNVLQQALDIQEAP